MLNVVILNVVILSVVMLNVTVQNAVVLNAFMLNVIKLSVIMLSIIMLSVVMLNVVATLCYLGQHRTNKCNPICDASPMVAKVSCVTATCIFADKLLGIISFIVSFPQTFNVYSTKV
jgi:hypothetical protein